jgi:hypothetical protein
MPATMSSSSKLPKTTEYSTKIPRYDDKSSETRIALPARGLSRCLFWADEPGSFMRSSPSDVGDATIHRVGRWFPGQNAIDE